MNKFEEYLSMAKISDLGIQQDFRHSGSYLQLLQALQQSQQLLSVSTSIYPARMM